MDFDLLDKKVIPNEIEKKWYSFWEKEKLFKADKNSNREKYSLVIPPPNVTGVLHMGHALNVTLQDILCRYHRIKGHDVLWIPGTDHAGIATQNVVERDALNIGDTCKDIGREKFIEIIWKWKEKYHKRITDQLKRLGVSCDWDLERFTMDSGLSYAVRKVFVQLYNEDLIYKGKYITNWCPRCHTALSDLEVEHEEREGSIYKIKYFHSIGHDFLIVATTRPETIFGDTAVAVNPSDNRYEKLENKKVLLPIIGKKIPIIYDKYVDDSFGTGVLKITPAHDPNDFDIGQRHNLECIKVIDENGCMNSNALQFSGLDRYECRKQTSDYLKKSGHLISVDSYVHNIGVCYRCRTDVEPNLSEQWFIKTRILAKKAIKTVETKKIRIFPKNWEKTYYNWMYNIKDWCISRQIWWGHQIPAWTCSTCNELIVSESNPTNCKICNGVNLIQESDVLDTWFSSSLWPFSSMGWPQKKDLFSKYFPTSILITGFDILFFWVARMIMMSLYAVDQIPFKDVYVHALVRDENGEKMSKSKGNVINPIEVIDKYGCDAFRFALASLAAQGRDIKISEKRISGYRNFVNKLWNVSRFSLFHFKKGFSSITGDHLKIFDYWILLKFNKLIVNVSNCIDNYRFNDAAINIYKFVWHEFCDWYIESIKPVLYGNDNNKESVISVLWFILKDLLILLHPFLPFVTEEIWSKLPGTSGSLMNSKYPDYKEYSKLSLYKENIEEDIQIIINLINKIRNIRGEMDISYGVLLEVVLRPSDEKTDVLIRNNMDLIVNLAKLKKISLDYSKKKYEFAVTDFVNKLTIFIILKDIIDFKIESVRLQKELNKLYGDIRFFENKLNNNAFLNKAPKKIVEEVNVKYLECIQKSEKVKKHLNQIKNMVGY